MNSSIYISSGKIIALGYSRSGAGISIDDYLSRPLLEGTMINGKITDPAHLTECLAAMRGEKPELFRSPVLTVDGSTIFSKKIAAPKLNKWRYIKLVEEEFADSAENPENLVSGYQLLDGSSGAPQEIMACAADRSQVDSYISTFHAAGIKLKAIKIGVQAILSYIGQRADLKGQTFVLNVIDGVSMLTMIFDKGKNVLISRTRLYGEEPAQLVRDLLDNLSGLNQFARSEKLGDISQSYYLGLSDEELNLMSEMNPHEDITISRLNITVPKKGRALDSDAHFAYLGALAGGEGIDLIACLKTLDKLKKRERPKALWIPALAGVLLLIAIPFAYLTVQQNNVLKDINEVNEYLTDEKVVAKSLELDGIAAETGRFNGIVGQMDEKAAEDKNIPTITNRVLDLITQTAVSNVRITQLEFTESTGSIRVAAVSATLGDSSEYVEALKKSNMVESVGYSGYNYGSEGVFNFAIDIKLTAAEVVK